MEIYAKAHVHKVDPKHPQSTDPTYEPARRKAEWIAKRHPPTFESKAEEAEYNRRVAGNPNNFYGIPTFFFPHKEPFQGQVENPARECECGGCAIATGGYICPRCSEFVQIKRKS
jgi:hypothetical protein